MPEAERLKRAAEDPEAGGPAFDGATPGAAPGKSSAHTASDRVPAAEPSAPASGAGGLPAYLAVADPKARAWLSRVAAEAERSRTGRAVLGRLEALSRERRRPIVVELADIRANNGEYVYDWELVRLGRHYIKEEPGEAAVTLVHELLHVLQKAHGLPGDALEMELEAHVTNLKVTRELGLKFKAGSFNFSSDRKFRGDLWRYIRWLGKEHDTNIPLVGSSIRDYEDELRGRMAKGRRRIERLEKRLEAKLGVLAAMEASGQSSKAAETFRLDEVQPLEKMLKDEHAMQDWRRRDADLLADPAGRARYRAYARRVLEMVRRYHRGYPPPRASRP